MGNAVEEKEIWCLDGPDEHDPATRNNKTQCDNVEDSDDIENDIAGASLLEVLEHGKDVEHFGGYSGDDREFLWGGQLATEMRTSQRTYLLLYVWKGSCFW